MSLDEYMVRALLHQTVQENECLRQTIAKQEAASYRLNNLSKALAAAALLARAEISFMRGAPLTGLELQVRASRLVWP